MQFVKVLFGICPAGKYSRMVEMMQDLLCRWKQKHAQQRQGKISFKRFSHDSKVVFLQ
jgi:hypothetical protein